MHLMRSMEFQSKGITEAAGVVAMRQLEPQIGQGPYDPPSVFNFYLPDFEPDGFPEGAVGPEFQIFTPPWVFGFINGVTSLIGNGLGDCQGGFGLAGWKDRDCS